MFNEREALRLRLEQLGDAEIQVMRELRKERQDIYSKLRELDRGSDPVINKKSSLIDLASAAAEELKQSQHAADKHPSTKTPSYTIFQSKTTIHREAALNILSRHEEGLKGIKLKTEIEKETGFPIKNMTTFMKSLMKHHPEIKKPARGHYILQKPKSL
ncbi:hypothetical protein [Bacillus haynesii]|uniref:Rok-like winged helix domain-containing protein n=1 Tax=Bacillus haynesii TaxID=1925021 RepID=UPI002280E70B|nr:hypothetical protein [Bacillus haynesii]MCY7860458.1 hypothetical protein [Bacillus haynesii]